MAAFVRTSLINNFIDREKSFDTKRVKDAVEGGSAESAKATSNLINRTPDFIVKGTTDGSTAALNAGAAQSFLINLTTEGLVSFPTGFDRDIVIECWTQDETTRNYQKIQQTVRGGSDPTLVNGVSNLGPKVGGLVTFATAAATAAHAYGGFSITSTATAPGRYAAAIPKARRVINTSGTVQVVGTGTLSGAGVVSLNAIVLATGVIEIGIRGGDDGANVAPADTEQVAIEFDVLPVESPELAIVTTTSPDQVIVGAVGQASENVVWEAHIYIGPLNRNALATATE